MAYIYGSPGTGGIIGTKHRGRDIFLRTVLPLILLAVLISASALFFLAGDYIVTAFCIVCFVLLVLRFEELGLTLVHRCARADRKFRSDQIVAQALLLLTDEYHVFHDLAFKNEHIDHAVVGPNGFFLITTKAHIGKISTVRDALRLNGWPFLGDPIRRCWRKSQTLMKCLDLHASGAIQVCPVLCFTRGSVRTDRFVRGVMVTEASTLARMILEQENPLASDKVLLLTALLAPLVRVKGIDAVPSAGFAAGGAAPTSSNSRVCEKCSYAPSALEAELFPEECPRCGRLHSISPQADISAAAVMLRPSAALILTTCITVAVSAGYLAHRSGLLDLEPSALQARIPGGSSIPESPPAPSVVNQPAAVPSPAESPATIRQPEPEQAIATTMPEQTETAKNGGTLPKDAAPANGTVPLAAGEPGPAETAPPQSAACQPEAGAAVPAGARDAGTPAAMRGTASADKAPARNPFEGTLTIITSSPATLWLTNDDTRKHFGPYQTRGRRELEIVLPKGCYTVVTLENGKRRRTTVSFLSDAGRLEF